MHNKDWTGGVPLISVLVICFEGNYHLMRRAMTSLRLQDLDPALFEVVIGYDGDLTAPNAEHINEELEAACHGCNFAVKLIAMGQNIGFHTVPRNRLTPVTCLGAYVVNMDADNEFEPSHLSGLLTAIRTPDKYGLVPHFVYSRREYVNDPGCKKAPYVGKSPLVEWKIGKVALAHGPKYNFVDTGDIMVSRAVMYELAARTGTIWNEQIRRFPDFDLVKRMAQCGFNGREVDQVTNIYHWTGDNIQLTSDGEGDIVTMPASFWEDSVRKGLWKDKR